MRGEGDQCTEKGEVLGGDSIRHHGHVLSNPPAVFRHHCDRKTELSDERPRMPSRCCKRVAEKATMTVNTVDTVWSELPDEKGRARVV